MRQLLCFTGLMALLWGCGPDSPKITDPLSFMPAGMHTRLKVHHTSQFRAEIQNNEILEGYRKLQTGKWLSTLDSILELSLGEEAWIGWSKNTAGNREWLLVFETPNFDISDSLDITETQWKLPERVGWKTATSDVWQLVASSEEVLNQALSGNHIPDDTFKTALKIANPEVGATLFVPARSIHPFAYLFGEAPVDTLSKSLAWSSYDLRIKEEGLLLEGMEPITDSILRSGGLFAKIPPLPLPASAEIVPADSDAWCSFSLQDPAQFLANQYRLLGKTHNWTALVESVEQLSLLELEGQVAVVLHALNPEGISSILAPFQTELPEFQEVTVYSLQQNGMLREAFAPLLGQLSDPGYFARLNQYFVFTPTLETLQNWISSYKREDTFSGSGKIEGVRSQLISEGSALAVALQPKSTNLLRDTTFLFQLPESVLAGIPKDYLFSAQVQSSEGSNFTTFSLQRQSGALDQTTSVSLKFSLKLDGLVTAGPFFLKNHITGHRDIAVQDNQNQLYLFSEAGALLWKKELSGVIQGQIHQLDLFKNGRLQMAFTTQDELQVLDRNGEAVKPFPLKFPGGNLNPLALFDYEQNKNYRLVVTQGKKVFMYDGSGAEVKGFKFREAQSPVVRAPQHFRIGNRDYLVFRLENGTLKILNRVGDTRVKVAETFAFSENDIFLFENTFTFTDRKGQLISINPSGKISRKNLNLNSDHGLYATSKTLAVMDDNLLKIKGQQATLDLGVYLGPQIHYLNDIIYVATTDIQSHKLYLFRSTAVPLAGFPVEAEGLPEMADLDGDRDPELGVRFRDSTVAIYGLKR